MRQIVECVPNFSEGRNTAVIDAIADSVRAVKGVKLLSAEPDKDYNRTVVTFAGDPTAVAEAAFQATKTAAGLIDMALHKGAHPRIGAADVVPFVPISGVSIDDCIRLANIYGERTARDLGIPIYLYEYAARAPERKNLAEIRKGEYEGLSEKLKSPGWAPDYGKPIFNAKSGATVTGARKVLIAYNVNLDTADERIAHEIALRIREIGRPKRDETDAVVKDEHGKTVRIPGTLNAVKAMGVLLRRCNIAQVSINLVDYEITSMHDAFDEVRRQARLLGVNATGSELVGLAPLSAMLMAGRHYAGGGERDERELVALAIRHLGLSDLEPFIPEKKIIDYAL